MSLVKSLIALVALAMLAVPTESASAEPPDSPATLATGSRPVIASDNQGHLHVVYEAGNDGKSHLYYLQSSDQGKAWTNPIDISCDQRLAQYASITVDKDQAVDAVWNGIKDSEREGKADVYFARSSDGGKTFSPARAIFSSSCKSSGPSIAAGFDGGIHIVWCEVSATSAEKLIFYSRSNDNGLTWSAKQLLALENQKEGSGVSSQPTVGVSDDGVVHAAWVDVTPGKIAPDIFYAKYENGTWSKPTNVSCAARIAQQPVIACGRQHKVFLTWVDNSRKEMAQDIWCSLDSHELGFSKPFNISNTPGVSNHPAMTADRRGRVVIVWSDTTSGLSKPDIYGRVSLDSLADFSNLIDFSNTEGVSLHPRVAIAGERAYVVWEENQPTVTKVFMNWTSLIGVATGPTPKVDQEIHGGSSTNR
jgi:hypothetical protein